MEAARVIVGGIVALGTITIRWVYLGRERKAFGFARRRGLSMWQVPAPYNRFLVSGRCEIWTLLGAFIGALVGAGLGWAYLGSVVLGVLLGAIGAVVLGWRYRVVTAIVLIGEPPGPPPRRVRLTGSRLQWAVFGIVCGLIVGATVGPMFDQHGTTLVIETALGCAFLARGFVRLRDGR